MPKDDDDKPTQTVKLRPSTCERMYRIADLIAKRGWREVSETRGDPATQANIIDEALTQLEAKFRKGS